ncbi:pseudouridine synthase family protein [Artemisia annua]|uniref:Pseudouridine synthase family protein n=1 Tax=Artemisia annua TaxID=35608 RepID=A0A2U1PGP4_ARTAN|nr:pseudouridine synthase family protein [Artemisia annua]
MKPETFASLVFAVLYEKKAVLEAKVQIYIFDKPNVKEEEVNIGVILLHFGRGQVDHANQTTDIRAHAKYLGIPLMGDEVYGGSKKMALSRLQLKNPSPLHGRLSQLVGKLGRPCLHALTLLVVNCVCEGWVKVQNGFETSSGWVTHYLGGENYIFLGGREASDLLCVPRQQTANGDVPRSKEYEEVRNPLYLD